MASWLSLGIGIKSLDPLLDPLLVLWVLGSWSMQYVPGGWINWYNWLALTLTWPKSNRTYLSHVSIHPTPPGSTSTCPGAPQGQGGGDTGGHQPSSHIELLQQHNATSVFHFKFLADFKWKCILLFNLRTDYLLSTNYLVMQICDLQFYCINYICSRRYEGRTFTGLQPFSNR